MKHIEARCHNCPGQAVLVAEETELKFGARVIDVVDEFMRCAGCGSEFYLPGQMEATQQRAAANARAAEGLLTPAEILAIRQGLRLTQAEFERLLGVGPKTVVRWERGTVFQNKATDSLLRLIHADRNNARILAARNESPGSNHHLIA
jgi:HTH-type transcriptional regulator / antitoxin MqsA